MSGHGKGFGANPEADLPVVRLYLPVDRPAGIQAEGERSGPENEEKETGGSLALTGHLVYLDPHSIDNVGLKTQIREPSWEKNKTTQTSL